MHGIKSREARSRHLIRAIKRCSVLHLLEMAKWFIYSRKICLCGTLGIVQYNGMKVFVLCYEIIII
uniref:Uncharacterized protein n=1 Tax=Anguilla anguilla TaxID=7936 RepID=A0A0E9SY60_ANGAN